MRVLLDDAEKRQTVGSEIDTNLKADLLPLPAQSDTFISHFLSQAVRRRKASRPQEIKVVPTSCGD